MLGWVEGNKRGEIDVYLLIQLNGLLNSTKVTVVTPRSKYHASGLNFIDPNGVLWMTEIKHINFYRSVLSYILNVNKECPIDLTSALSMG